MNKQLIINEPYIQETGSGVRLCSDIELPGEVRTMYFEVESKWARYLNVNTSDAFLVGLLNFAMTKGLDIVCKVPVNERLIYQIRTYIEPTLGEGVRKNHHHINIRASVSTEQINNEGAIGTSASGGVDSFYSIIRHLSVDIPSRYRVTHLLIVNQFNIYKSEKNTRAKFQEILEHSKPIAENYGLELIGMYTNHHDFMFPDFVQEYSYRICSYALALQKLFAGYYVSSGVAFKDFNFNGHDSDGSDAFNLPLVSTDNLTFYSSGGERMRSDKIALIANDPYVQKNLFVCNMGGVSNCSKCEKCLRTMASLDMLGVLDKYTNVFDTSNFEKHKKMYYGTVLAKEWEASDDIIKFAKKKNYKFPVSSYLYAFFVRRPYFFMKSRMSKTKWITKLYYKLNIDVLRFGKEMAMQYRYGKEI